MTVTGKGPAVTELRTSVYRVPTDLPEADGTLEWDSTTLVLVEATAGVECGLGYTYADRATASLVRDRLADIVVGLDAMNVSDAWERMVRSIRNLGRPGIASMAVSAVDSALWDLKAKLLGVPLAQLLGMVRPSVAVYGSGGFTSYSPDQLTRQLAGWAEEGVPAVKMKVGAAPEADAQRVVAAREAIGDEVALFVDANGAYTRKQALHLAEGFADCDVTWFEEPVSSDDLEGLRLLRDRAPAIMDIAAGEYGYDLYYFRRMLAAGAVDVLQADATRCAGITGFLRTGALCQSFGIPLSSHCAPALHVAAACALPSVVHMEYFHDHVRVEHLLFEGAPDPHEGQLAPTLDAPGLGLTLRRRDAERYAD